MAREILYALEQPDVPNDTLSITSASASFHFP